MLARGILIERWGKSLLSVVKSPLDIEENSLSENHEEIHK